MVAGTLGAMARYEVEHKSERTKRAQAQAAQAGKWLGGAPPLGWHLHDDGSATLDKKAANRIAHACQDVLAGVSLGSIVTAWNADGFTTGTGKRWGYTQLRQVLTRARNAGLVEYNGAIVAASQWPAIVTEEDWRGVCALLADPSRRRSQTNKAKHLLAGIAVCGKDGCGQPLRSASVGDKKGGNRTVYRCTAPGIGHVARSAPDLDALITELVEARLGRDDVADLLHAPCAEVDTVALRAEATRLRARLAEVADAYAQDEIDLGQLTSITGTVKARLGEVEANLAGSNRTGAAAPVVSATDPVAAWQACDLDRKRTILRELLTVTVLPGLRGKVFDPELVEVAWV
jgi:hypothetical protein